MNKAYITVALIALLAVGLVGASYASAHGRHYQCRVREAKSDKVIVETDILTVEVRGDTEEGIKPILVWYFTADQGKRARYMVKFVELVEFNDADGDKAYDLTESVWRVNLVGARWDYSVDVEDAEDGYENIHVYLWVKEWYGEAHTEAHEEHTTPPVPTPSPVPENLNVTIAIHIYAYVHSFNVTDSFNHTANYTVAGGAEAKIDIHITGWEFESESHMLTIRMLVDDEYEETGYEHCYKHRFKIGNETVDEDEIGNEAHTHKFEHEFRHCEEVGLVESSTNSQLAYVKWNTWAIIDYGNYTEMVNVTASYRMVQGMMELWLCYPYFPSDATLIHDPSVGVVEGAEDTLLGLPTVPVEVQAILVAVAVAGVTFLAKRRR